MSNKSTQQEGGDEQQKHNDRANGQQILAQTTSNKTTRLTKAKEKILKHNKKH